MDAWEAVAQGLNCWKNHNTKSCLGCGETYIFRWVVSGRQLFSSILTDPLWEIYFTFYVWSCTRHTAFSQNNFTSCTQIFENLYFYFVFCFDVYSELLTWRIPLGGEGHQNGPPQNRPHAKGLFWQKVCQRVIRIGLFWNYFESF